MNLINLDELNDAEAVVEKRRKLSILPDNETANGRAVSIDGVLYRITCPRFKKCRGPTYNEGFVKYLCAGNHRACSTQNPDVCTHGNFTTLGHRARYYPELVKRIKDRYRKSVEQRLRIQYPERVESEIYAEV